MTKNQNIVMWCGLIILLIYLFTDKNFKAAIFKNPANGAGLAPGASLGLGVTLTSKNSKAVSNPWGFPTDTPVPATPAQKATTL